MKNTIKTVYLPSFEQYDVFDVWGVGEHIHRLHFCHAVVTIHHAQVTRLGGWIAADIDDALRLGIQYGLHHIGMHTGTWRVGNDNVRPAMLGNEVVGKYVLHVTSKELRIADAVNLRVYLCILNGLRHILYAYDLCRFPCNEIGYRSGAGVEVVDEGGGEGRGKM